MNNIGFGLVGGTGVEPVSSRRRAFAMCQPSAPAARQLSGEVVLLCALEQAQLGGLVLQFSRAFAGGCFALPAPPLDVGPAEHCEGFALADIVGVGYVFFQEVDNLGGHVFDEHAVWHAFVGELEEGHHGLSVFVGFGCGGLIVGEAVAE